MEINLKDLCDVISTWAESPDNEDFLRSLNRMKSDISIKTYIPIGQKQELLRKVLSGSIFLQNTTDCDFSISSEISLTLNGLLAYTNIIGGEEIDVVGEKYYDLLWSSEIANYIYDMCKFDFDKLCQMYRQTLEYYNVNQIQEMIDGLDVSEIEKSVDKIGNLYSQLDKETIHDLSQIMGANDANIANIRDSIDKTVYDTLNR